MSEEYEDDIEEQEETHLRGEYVWDGKLLTSVDSNVNDTGHAGYFNQIILSNLKDDAIELGEQNLEWLRSLPEKTLTDDQSESLNELPKLIKKLERNEEHIDFNDIQSILYEIEIINPKEHQEFMESKQDLFQEIGRAHV